jgi:hypothetical protein
MIILDTDHISVLQHEFQRNSRGGIPLTVPRPRSETTNQARPAAATVLTQPAESSRQNDGSGLWKQQFVAFP